MKRAKQLTLVLAALIFLVPAAANADPIVLTLDPTHTVAAGSTVTFQGTFSNLGSPSRSIPSVTFSFSGGFADFTFNPDDFFAAVPLIVDPGFTTGATPVDFFDVTVAASVTPGTYTGTFSVVIECDPADTQCTGVPPQNFATQDFTLIVQGAGQVIPEPASMFLLATGLGGAALAKRRARRKEKSDAGI